MANTKVQLMVEGYVREVWMHHQFGQVFKKDQCQLSSGGRFEFDAISLDGSVVACISTSGAKTASGKSAIGKHYKIRSDILFLVLARAERRLLVLTEPTMHEWCAKEVLAGRIPASIELYLADVPDHLVAMLKASSLVSSKEVSPSRQAAE